MKDKIINKLKEVGTKAKSLVISIPNMSMGLVAGALLVSALGFGPLALFLTAVMFIAKLIIIRISK